MIAARSLLTHARCSRLLLGVVVSGLLLLWGAGMSPSFAQSTESLDEQLLRRLENPGASTRDETIARLLENTASARERLSNQQLDRQTQDVQAQILRDFDKLLEQLDTTPPSTGPSSGSPAAESSAAPDASSGQQEPSGQSGEQSPSGATNPSEEVDPNAAASDSTERSTPGSLTEVERSGRIARATAAWGHLPPKVREELRGAFNESYLPQYDELVRRYYEALAEKRRAATNPSP